MISLPPEIKNANAIRAHTDRRFAAGQHLRYDSKIGSLAEASLAPQCFREAGGTVM